MEIFARAAAFVSSQALARAKSRLALVRARMLRVLQSQIDSYRASPTPPMSQSSSWRRRSPVNSTLNGQGPQGGDSPAREQPQANFSKTTNRDPDSRQHRHTAAAISTSRSTGPTFGRAGPERRIESAFHPIASEPSQDLVERGTRTPCGGGKNALHVRRGACTLTACTSGSY